MTIEPIKEKLDDKIAKLNSSRVYKKVTPKGDLSWYIKWASSITLIIAMMFTAVELFPLNMFIANSVECYITCNIFYGFVKLLLWLDFLQQMNDGLEQVKL